MLRKVGIPFSSILFLSTLLYSQAEWENTLYTQWSYRQVNAVLNRSPWTHLFFAGRQLSGNLESLFGAERVFFRVRVLTARPVREALLRQLLLREKIVDIRDLLKGPSAFDRALTELVASRPDDVRVAGDSEHIILAVTLLALSEDRWEELNDCESLSNGNIPELTEDATLETNAGRHVGLVNYEPPGSDRLGAKLYFPRYLPDGTPLIKPGDRELRFIARVKDRKVVVDFDLKQMKYHGKLEL